MPWTSSSCPFAQCQLVWLLQAAHRRQAIQIAVLRELPGYSDSPDIQINHRRMFHLYHPFLFLFIIAGSKSNKKASAQKRTKDRPRGKTRSFLANPFFRGIFVTILCI
ncbi:MAG TPA: hypothetical protein DEP43_08270 [Ruminococcaceae bacterium]|nr:hypothetical protein [Oscillospiraceae bacterium]